MFKKFFDEMLKATTQEELFDILYRADGVEMSFQREKLNWQDHERLFTLADKLCNMIALEQQIKEKL